MINTKYSYFYWWSHNDDDNSDESEKIMNFMNNDEFEAKNISVKLMVSAFI